MSLIDIEFDLDSKSKAAQEEPTAASTSASGLYKRHSFGTRDELHSSSVDEFLSVTNFRSNSCRQKKHKHHLKSLPPLPRAPASTAAKTFPLKPPLLTIKD